MTTGMSPALASRQRRSIVTDAVSGIGSSRGPHVSIRGGRFRLIGADGVETLLDTHYLDLIFIDANSKTSKVFFENVFDPGNMDVPPTCFSDNGTGPSAQASTPQSATCAVCPWNVRGSDTSFTGKAIKACSDRKKMAVIVPDDPGVNVYEMQIPPGSLTNLRAYAEWIGKQASGVEGRKMDIADFVTRVSFDPDKQFVMQFQPVAFADDDRTLQLIGYIDQNQLADVAVGRTDVAVDPKVWQALPTPQAPALPPAQAPAQFALPPRQAAPQQQAIAPPPAMTAQEAANTAPARPPSRRGRPAAVSAPAQQTPIPVSPATAPFIAPAAPRAAIPIAVPGNLDVPDFLKRDPQTNTSHATAGASTTRAAPPAPPAPRFGVGQAPPPPAGVADALNNAMNLPTRR